MDISRRKLMSIGATSAGAVGLSLLAAPVAHAAESAPTDNKAAVAAPLSCPMGKGV